MIEQTQKLHEIIEPFLSDISQKAKLQNVEKTFKAKI
jgi:hypothetical protein